MGALSCRLRLSSAAGIRFPGSWCGCRWILRGPVTLPPGARVSPSQAGATGAGNNGAFSRGSWAEPAAVKQSARALGPRGLAGRERGCRGHRCQALAGLEGGWASRVPGNRSRLDTRGVSWSIFRARLCLPACLTLGLVAGWRRAGREEMNVPVGARGLGQTTRWPLVSPRSLGPAGGEHRGRPSPLPLWGQRCSGWRGGLRASWWLRAGSLESGVPAHQVPNLQAPRFHPLTQGIAWGTFPAESCIHVCICSTHSCPPACACLAAWGQTLSQRRVARTRCPQRRHPPLSCSLSLRA